MYKSGLRKVSSKAPKNSDEQAVIDDSESEIEDADKFDPHIVCFSWPNCDESPLGCVVRNGLGDILGGLC